MMERNKDMDTHLEMAEILRLAMRGEYNTHFVDCAFCREQYEDALEFEQYQSEENVTTWDGDRQGNGSPQRYRLAAQDSEESPDKTHLRRTWYLESGDVILRVMEDTEQEKLYGHLILDPDRYASVVIRFSGIEQDFLPDSSGLFEIGSSSLAVERMDVTMNQRGTSSE
jgi:hypothetical protein